VAVPPSFEDRRNNISDLRVQHKTGEAKGMERWISGRESNELDNFEVS
jgi:hypothetical protein